MKLLDLYCCSGGSAVGYALGGFTSIIGIDIKKKRDYPYEFIQADIIDFIQNTPREWFDQFDLIHASPPCRGYSITKVMTIAQGNKVEESADHLPMIQEFLRSLNIPYVIENVERAKVVMKDPVILCGSSFGLKVRRHRAFEASFPIEQLPCKHKEQGKPIGVYGSMGDTVQGVDSKTGRYVVGGSTAKTLEEALEAMGISHITTWSALKEAIPPAYTEHIAKSFKRNLQLKNQFLFTRRAKNCN